MAATSVIEETNMATPQFLALWVLGYQCCSNGGWQLPTWQNGSLRTSVQFGMSLTRFQLDAMFGQDFKGDIQKQVQYCLGPYEEENKAKLGYIDRCSECKWTPHTRKLLIGRLPPTLALREDFTGVSDLNLVFTTLGENGRTPI